MDILKNTYTITELSKETGLTDHTLRYYEKEFNIDIPRDSRGRRYYPIDKANLMFKIKQMREEGLGIKAISSVLSSDSYLEEPLMVSNDESSSIITTKNKEKSFDMQEFFNDFKLQMSESISKEVNAASEKILGEIKQSKLEIGACVENSSRKLEMKLEKHFLHVDNAIGIWREKKRGSIFKRKR